MKLTQKKIIAIQPNGTKQWFTDDAISGLRLYVAPQKGRSWFLRFKDCGGRRMTHKLGDANALTLEQARDAAKRFLACLSLGENLHKKKAESITLGAYLRDVYFPTTRRTLKSADETIRKIAVNFKEYFDTPIDALSPITFERWRTARLENKAKAATVNRILSTLKSAISWGVKRGLIEANPLQRLGKLKESDSKSIVRYLGENERERLEAALFAREAGKDKTGEFYDYLRPAVLLSLNTGIRRNTLFSLLWRDVDFDSQTLTLRGEVSKNGKTARIPLNDDAADILSSWRSQSAKTGADDLIFPSPQTGEKLDNARRSWESILRAAEIENFRWHDMRHDFASQLVMKGVDLTVVCELMNHSNLKLTMRYAHLAPKQKLDAVQALNRRTKGDKIIGRIRKASA
jgi:site-specific recombinase XerD